MEFLARGVGSALDISRAVGIPEKEVALHLKHIAKTLQGRGGRLVVTPALGRNGAFTSRKRERYTRPGKCPLCKKGPIEPPLFEMAVEGP